MSMANAFDVALVALLLAMAVWVVAARAAFSAIVVFAQELMPGKVGAVSGLFFGFAFGIGGIGAAVLGGVADRHGIEFVYRICAYLPLLGMVAAFLPNIEHHAGARRQAK